MSMLPGPWNPITYAQFYVGGGWRTTLTVVVGYAALLGGGIYLSAAHDDRPGDVLEAWTHGLLLLQIANLFGFGTFRVNAAVRADIASRMIESHRLMPTPPISAVAGYVLGTPAVSVALFGVTAVAGAACTAGSGGRVSPDQWWAANALVAAAGVCAWAVVAQFAFTARGGFVLLLVGGVVATGLFATGSGLSAIPALNVLTAPLLSRSVVALQRGFGRTSWYGVSLAAQAAVTAVCVRVAVRRYRSDTVAGFSPLLGLLLVATWVASAAVALRWPGRFDSRLYWRRPQSIPAAYTSTVAGGLLLASVPLASAARAVAGPGSAARRWGPLVVTAALAAAVVAAVAGVAPRDLPAFGSTGFSRSTAFDPAGAVVGSRPVAVTTAAATAWVAGTAGLFAGLAGRRRAWAPVVLWIGTTWIGPVVVDEIYQTLTQATAVKGPTWLTGLSPVGAVAIAYDAAVGRDRTAVSLVPGLAGQAIVAGVAVAVAGLVVRRRRPNGTDPL